jgi:hypothetical protein
LKNVQLDQFVACIWWASRWSRTALFLHVLMAQSGAEDPTFPYVHLWVSADGETHLQECTFKNFEKKTYAAGTDPQFTLTGPEPSKLVLTELVAGTQQDWHAAPAVQMVTCVSGSW